MPALATQLASGSGVYRAALVVAGWPKIFVDSDSLEGNLADGRQRITALDPETLRIAAKSDLIRAEIEQQSATVELTEDWQGRISASLARIPTARCWITSDVSTSATTINVTSTDGFASGGVVHLATEAVKYTGKTSTTFTGCTRGHWGSTALAHYTGDGTRRVAALVTDYPETMIGRRASVYLWGSSDSDAGNGTERWRGIVRDAPEYQGGRWTIGVEPVSWILDQPVGGELTDTLPIRGIYLPSLGAWAADIQRHSGASETDALSSDQMRLAMSGYFEDNAELCTALQAAWDAASSGWSGGGTVTFLPLGSDGYRIEYRTGATPYFLTFDGGGVRFPWLSPVDFITGRWYSPSAPTVTAATFTGNNVYRLDVRAPVPRAALGDHAATQGMLAWHDPARSFNGPDRIYVGGSVAVNASWTVSLTPDNQGIDPDADPMDAFPPSNLSYASTADRWVSPGRGWIAKLGPNARLRVMRQLARGDVGHLIDALIADSPADATLGTLPLVVSSDWSTDYTELREAIAGSGWQARIWMAGGESLTLRDLIVPELRAVGCYLAPTSTGALSIRRLRPPLRTDPVAGTVDADVMTGGLPALSLSAQGHVREVLYRSGWNQIEGEHQGDSIRVRSLAVPSSTGGTLEVAPRSITDSPGAPEYSIEQAYLLASGVLGLFGRPYRIVSCEASIAVIDAAQVGAVVVVTTDDLPALDGTLGLDAVGLVTGYDWRPYEGRGTLSILLQELETGGYSPSFLVSSQSGSGTAWAITITLSPSTTEASVATWLGAGDEIRLIERDTETPTLVSGTIDSVDSATVVSVTLDSSWTPGASEWILGYDTTASADETRGARGWAQTDYAMIAGSDRRVALGSGDVDAREWAP